MKKIVLLAAMALVGFGTYAQEIKKDTTQIHKRNYKKEYVKTGERSKSNFEKKDRNLNEVKLTPEQKNELRVKKLTLALNLTDKQQKKIIALNNETINNRPQIKKGEKLSEEQIFQLKSQRLDNQIAYKRSMEKILSKEQFTQWEKMSQKRGRMQHNKNMRHSNNMQMAQKTPMKMEKNNQL